MMKNKTKMMRPKMKKISKRIIFLFFLIANQITGWVYAQPVFDSKSIIENVAIYGDHKKPTIFYYEPRELVLKTLDNGKPDFQFLDMRYTGSKCHNDQGDKSFMSLLQIGFEMKPWNKTILKKIKSQLGRAARLVPLPISNLNTQLIIPSTGNSALDNDVIKNGTLDADGKRGLSSSSAFWKSRVFTIKLNAYESQLLMDGLKDNAMVLSLNYSFYTNFYVRTIEELEGSPEVLEKLQDDNESIEQEPIENRVVKSDASPIYVDIKKHPDLIKQIDLNEGIPPTYAGIEIKCYDFKENLRPDLFMKIVEVVAQSVNGKDEVKQEVKFLKKHGDLTTHHISFPYAVYADVPMRYRITEVDIQGNRKTKDWIQKETCHAEIDATTPLDQQNIGIKTIEVEIDQEHLWQDYKKVEVLFAYSFNDIIHKKEVSFSSQLTQSRNEFELIFDKNQPIYIQIRKFSGEDTPTEEVKVLDDAYVYIH